MSGEGQRAQAAGDLYRTAFGAEPAGVICAPGRVNLAGEHTDYAGLPVLSMAIDRGIAVAYGDGPPGVVQAESAAYPGRISLRRGAGRHQEGWAAYLAGAMAELGDAGTEAGASLAIASDLPMDGGLGASSALTTGCVSALAATWGLSLDGWDAARRTASAERGTGSESGGMDPLVITAADAGHALRVDFHPQVSSHAVPLPGELAFVAASSGEARSHDSAAVDAHSERVVGMRCATVLLGEMLGFEHVFPLRLADVADADVVELLVDELPPRIRPRDVARSGNIRANQITRLAGGAWDVDREVPVRQVAQHMLAEAARVNAAESALTEGNVRAYGKTLDASHDSLRQAMRCSTPALDRVGAAMRKAGAHGARLCGAGFGGFVLAACPPDGVEQVLAAGREASGGGEAFEVHSAKGAQPCM